MGIGAFIFGFVTNYIVNPLNTEPHPVEVAPGINENFFSEEVNSRVPWMFDVLCMIWGGQLVFAFFTVSIYKGSNESITEHLIE
jgi:hypothetical protein